MPGNAEIVETIRDLMDNSEATVDNRHMRLKWTIDLGQIVQVFAFALTLGSAAWSLSATMAEMKKDIANAVIMGTTLSGDMKSMQVRTDSLAKNNDIQDERINNLSVAMAEIRRQNAEVSAKLGAISEDLASVKAKLSIERR